MARTSTIKASIQGDRELKAKLEKLGARAGAVLERSLLAGSEVIREAAAAKAPGPDVQMEVRESSPTIVRMAVGPGRESWTYVFFEFGAQPHTITGQPLAFEGRDGRLVITSSVSHPGMPARPWLRPALDTRQEEAIKEIGSRLRSEIEKV